jgi:hypothetical protein
MSSESSFWKTLRKNMKGKWQPERIESMCGQGVPDVYATIDGIMLWIELKYAHEWPKRVLTPLRFEHYTPQQKNWIRRHGRAGANVFLFIQVEKDYLLFTWKDALKVGTLTKPQLMKIAYRHWKNRIDYSDLINSFKTYAKT